MDFACKLCFKLNVRRASGQVLDKDHLKSIHFLRIGDERNHIRGFGCDIKYNIKSVNLFSAFGFVANACLSTSLFFTEDFDKRKSHMVLVHFSIPDYREAGVRTWLQRLLCLCNDESVNAWLKCMNYKQNTC